MSFFPGEKPAHPTIEEQTLRDHLRETADPRGIAAAQRESNRTGTQASDLETKRRVAATQLANKRQRHPLKFPF